MQIFSIDVAYITFGFVHFFFMARQPLVGQGPIVDASRSLLHCTLGRLLSTQQPFAERQHTTLTRDRHLHTPGGIQPPKPSKRADAGPGLESHCPWERQSLAQISVKRSSHVIIFSAWFVKMS